MNGRNRVPVTLCHKAVRRWEKQEIGEVRAKWSLREYNFGSDTRMAWNARIGVNERDRRLRYVVNGRSLGPFTGPVSTPLRLVHATCTYIRA